MLRIQLKQILNLSTVSTDKLPPRTLFQAAIKRSNNKILTEYKMSRASIHRGNRPMEQQVEDHDPLFALCPAPVADAELEEMLNCMDEKRENFTQSRARLRLLAALRSQVKQAPPQLRNGDRFLYWKTETNLSKSRWNGPAVCLGQNRSLVLGLEGGHAFVVHSTRTRFHYRSELQQLKPIAHMPDNPELPPITDADQSLLSAVSEEEPNVYALSIGLHWSVVSAPKSWYDKLCEVLSSCGFKSCLSDDGLFRVVDNAGDHRHTGYASTTLWVMGPTPCKGRWSKLAKLSSLDPTSKRNSRIRAPESVY